MTQARNILIVCTSHSRMGDTGKATGLWAEELTTPYYTFLAAGAEVQIASIAGGIIPVDPNSCKARGENTVTVERYLQDADLQQRLANSTAVQALNWADYDAIFLPGGHGTMWDLPQSPALAALLAAAYTAGRIVAAVCHGPAGLLNVTLTDGTPLVKGKRLTAFTNKEEDAAGLTPVMPFLLESRLREAGAQFESAANFTPFAVADGSLITGQNPASSDWVAREVLAQLKCTAG